MPEMLKPVDVVVIGTGAAGGTAVWPLANAGMKVVAIEAGPRATVKDYPFDEIRNDIRDSWGRFKANQEVPDDATERARRRDPPAGCGRADDERRRRHVDPLDDPELALPRRGTSRPCRSRSKRYGPNAIPKDSTSIDWPFDYAELEPYYDKHEYFAGVSGQHGNIQGTIDPRGNIFEGPRRRKYPLPPLRNSGFTDMMDGRREVGGLASVSGPRRNPLEGLPRQGRLHVLRVLRLDRLLHEREGADERRLHPARREDEEPQGRPDGGRAHASKSTTRAARRACST